MRKERPNSQLLFLGVRGGMCMVLFFWVVWDLLIDVRVLRLDLARPRDKLCIATQLPMYRAGLAVVLLQFLWALCLYVWGKARINFEFMLDFSPRANTNAAVAFSAAARACIFYLLSVLLFAKALIGEFLAGVSPAIFPVAMFVVTFCLSSSPSAPAATSCARSARCCAHPCTPSSSRRSSSATCSRRS